MILPPRCHGNYGHIFAASCCRAQHVLHVPKPLNVLQTASGGLSEVVG